MRKFNRLPSPEILIDNWENWGNRYAVNKRKNTAHQLSCIKNGKKVNHLLISTLVDQSQNHCSYCDHYPPKKSDKTIDHFKPKGVEAFYHLAYHWENLYYSCADCQLAKGDDFDEALLRPDTEDFSFERYFKVNFSNGEIEINPNASEIDRNRAEVTIRILGLNSDGQPMSRKHSLERYEGMFLKGEQIDIDDFSFRFMFD